MKKRRREKQKSEREAESHHDSFLFLPLRFEFVRERDRGEEVIGFAVNESSAMAHTYSSNGNTLNSWQHTCTALPRMVFFHIVYYLYTFVGNSCSLIILFNLYITFFYCLYFYSVGVDL